MSQNTFEKIEELRDLAEGKDQETLDLLASAEKNLKLATLKDNLGKHEGMVMLRAAVNRKLEGLNKLLQEDDNMTHEERIRYMAQKRTYEWFEKFFNVASRNIEVINKEVDKRYNRKVI